jgi:hypothetical protein
LVTGFGQDQTASRAGEPAAFAGQARQRTRVRNLQRGHDRQVRYLKEVTMRVSSALVVAAVAVAAGCATVPVFEPREWNAEVQPRDDSGVRATVRAASGPGQTAVAINLAGGEVGGTHPWHIHRGTCATGGAIVGNPAAYPPLRPTSAGAATATAHIRVQLVPGEDYHVNVHRSPEQLGQILACGNLR